MANNKGREPSGSFTEFCFISEINVEDWLRNDLGISRSKIKEFHLKKKLLEKKTRKEENLKFPIDLINIHLINPVFTGSEIKILHTDNDLVTLSKPAGMHIFPLKYGEKDTVLNFLRNQNFGHDVLEVASHTHEKGALFRIDRVTSGLMVFARKASIYEQFRNKLAIQKYYLAVIEGAVTVAGEHRHFLSGLAKGGPKVRCSNESTAESVQANIEIIPLSYNQKLNLSLVGVVLNEGHRHQIRVQLAYLGFPILGDDLYGGRRAERVFLHAWAYRFGEKIFSDETCPLFGNFFDLDSGLKMFRNHCGISE